MQAFPHPTNIVSSVARRPTVERKWSSQLQGRFFVDNSLSKEVHGGRLEKQRFNKYLKRAESARLRFKRDSSRVAKTQQAIRARQLVAMEKILVLTSVIIIQTYWRGFIVRRTRTRKRANKMLCIMRALTLLLAVRYRLKKNVIKIQSIVRRFRATQVRKRRMLMTKLAIVLQARFRGVRARYRAGIAHAVRNIAIEVVETTTLYAASVALQTLILPDISAAVIQRAWLRYKEEMKAEQERIEKRLKELKERNENDKSAMDKRGRRGLRGSSSRSSTTGSRTGLGRSMSKTSSRSSFAGSRQRLMGRNSSRSSMAESNSTLGSRASLADSRSSHGSSDYSRRSFRSDTKNASNASLGSASRRASIGRSRKGTSNKSNKKKAAVKKLLDETLGGLVSEIPESQNANEGASMASTVPTDNGEDEDDFDDFSQSSGLQPTPPPSGAPRRSSKSIRARLSARKHSTSESPPTQVEEEGGGEEARAISRTLVDRGTLP